MHLRFNCNNISIYSNSASNTLAMRLALENKICLRWYELQYWTKVQIEEIG